MTKHEELKALSLEQYKEEENLRNEYFAKNPRPKGYGCFEIPGMRQISEKYRKRYGEILEKYKNE